MTKGDKCVCMCNYEIKNRIMVLSLKGLTAVILLLLIV